jgi:DUF2075 family protein
MILRVDEFRERVANDLSTLVSDLQFVTGRHGEEERNAWRNSLPRLAQAFSAPGFAPLHVYFQGDSELSLEYQLPASSSWCDVVLLGRNNTRPGAVIIELKNWQTQADYPATAAGLINHLGKAVLHPADQVRGYVEYCRRFHSAVQDYDASVHGCVLFTLNTNIQAYSLPPNDGLTAEFPCFAYTEKDLASPFPDFISRTITQPDTQFAEAFERGRYKQDRGFVRQIAAQILDPKESPFVLLDNQRRAFSLCRAQVESALFQQGRVSSKKVIVVDGPPGSGKSVVAAKIWASLASDTRMPEGPIVFTSTSASQNSNWSYLFQKASNAMAGSGIVKRATSYTPISTQTLGRLRKTHGKGFLDDAGKWRDNLRLVRTLTPFAEGTRDGEYLVSIVDEAHALINPEHVEGRGQFGFVTSLGPQAFHIMRVSQVTIFLMDERQSFRTRENTTVEDIRNWATELGAEFFSVSLSGHQFRCAGSKEYVDWVEAVLNGESLETCRILASAWSADQDSAHFEQPDNIIHFPKPEPLLRAAEEPPQYGSRIQNAPTTNGHGRLDFQIFDTPAAMEVALRKKQEEGNSVRLLAPYARPWATKEFPIPHDVPDKMKDIVIPYERNGEQKVWAKIWNHIPANGSDYSAFVQGQNGTRMSEDPLCEVGCPYAVRGFDWDYIGILWLSDLNFDRGLQQWVADPEHIHETGFSSLTTKARRERNHGPHQQNLLEAVVQYYRILLTRPIRGVYVWFENQHTKEYIERTLG